MASSSSSTRQMKHQVFLSFRGEDTRYNFTAHLLKALKDSGLNVFFDEDTLEKGEPLSPALSQGIASSNLSIIVLSKDYASSKSCLTELSETMDHKCTQGQIVLPIFYHVDPSDVRNLCGSFKTSFGNHESKGLAQVQRWKDAFAQIGKLKGWHIQGGKFYRPETEYIEDIVKYVIKKLMNSKSRSSSEELVGIDYQKNVILRMIEQEESRVIGLWGMGGIGKTTLAEAVYNEISLKFDDTCFLQNVSEKFEKQGMESLRDELLSKLLNQEIRIDTPSIGSTLIQERLKNKRVLVVLDDVNDSDQIDCMGIKHFGDGSKIIVTSRDRQVLMNGGVDKIHKVKKLNKNNSLQLFSTFAFKMLNPAVDFRGLSSKFVKYAQGSPLALRVLGSKLYNKTRKDWESEVDKLKEYAKPKISQILKRSFDGLDGLEKDIFLDISCFFKGELKENVEEILSCCYKGAIGAISSLVDKCLLDITPFQRISMHAMLEEMGKDIVFQESKDPGKRSRLWNPKDVYQVLKYNKGTESIQGIMLDMSQIDKLRLSSTVFENMLNLKFIHFISRQYWNKKLLAGQIDIASFPDELRYFCWDDYPFKSLSSSFNLKNLVVLILRNGNMEQLWNEDDYQDLVNLREIVLSGCKNLRKIPNLLGAIRLEILSCVGCQSLVELPCLCHLVSLKTLQLHGCYNLKKFPEVPNHFSELDLSETGIQEVPDSIEHLVKLRKLFMRSSMVKTISSNISKLESLEYLNFSDCPLAKFPEIPRSLTELYLCGSRIEEMPSLFVCQNNSLFLDMSDSSIQKLKCNIPFSCSREIPTNDVSSSILRFNNLENMKMNHCRSLKLLSELPPYLLYLNAHGCTSLENVSFADQNLYLYQLDYVDGDDEFFMIFFNCFSLTQESIDNIEANAMLKIRSVAKKDAYVGPKRLICCFPGNKISANKFKYQSMNSSLTLKISPNGCSGSRFLVVALCLVVDFRHCHKYGDLKCICEYQLRAAGGDGYEKFKSVWFWNKKYYKSERQYKGDHVLILFSRNMVKKDKNYEEASFEFHIKNRYYNKKGASVVEDIKVEKCGVHLSYVDEDQEMCNSTHSPVPVA